MTTEQLEQMLAEARAKRDKAFEEYQQYHGAVQVLTHLLAVLHNEAQEAQKKAEADHEST